MFEINHCCRTYPIGYTQKLQQWQMLNSDRGSSLGKSPTHPSYFGSLSPSTLNALVQSAINSVYYSPTCLLEWRWHYIFVLDRQLYFDIFMM